MHDFRKLEALYEALGRSGAESFTFSAWKRGILREGHPSHA